MKKVLCLCVLSFFLFTGCKKEEKTMEKIEEKENITEKITIMDLESKTRPIAVVINNSTAAVKVQTGLEKAYLVYEIPVEGGLTRLLAFYKDVENITIGTIRSARHNFLDYVLEQDALFVCYGWSRYAKKDMTSIGLDYINGVVNATAFWRYNPEKLATEHTAYTSIEKIKEYTKEKNFSTETSQSNLLKYSEKEILLNQLKNSQKTSEVFIPSSNTSSTAYKYDEESKKYKRFVNQKENIDYETKQQFTAKNIIIQKINTKMASDNYYWDLETIGSGEGFYITNGFAVPITWKKTSRNEKTCYNYLDGSELVVNDGNTYIQLQSTKQALKFKE